MSIKITAQQSDIEELIKEIATGSSELEGRGYINEKAGVLGLMIYSKTDPTKMLDIFVETDESEVKKLGIDGH